MKEIVSKQKEVVSFFLKNNIFISPDLISEITTKTNLDELYNLISNKITSSEFLLLNKDIYFNYLR